MATDVKRIGCFVENYNFVDHSEAVALRKFQQTAQEKGHTFDFIYKKDVSKIPEYDAIFIRATTDPTFTANVISRIAQIHNLCVVDNPQAIQICGNKIHMYGCLERAKVPYIQSEVISKENLCANYVDDLFKRLGTPLVLKAPYTSFSKYVDKAHTTEDFIKIAKKFFRKSHAIVIQKFMPSDFDWRVGVLNDEILYVAKYGINKGTWKHMNYVNGTKTYGDTESIDVKDAPEKLKKIAIDSCKAIGTGLYGVDIKEFNGEFIIVEVNDNPSLYAGFEDVKAPYIYEKIIDYLVK